MRNLVQGVAPAIVPADQGLLKSKQPPGGPVGSLPLAFPTDGLRFVELAGAPVKIREDGLLQPELRGKRYPGALALRNSRMARRRHGSAAPGAAAPSQTHAAWTAAQPPTKSSSEPMSKPIGSI
jgi:hypothetical protein